MNQTRVLQEVIRSYSYVLTWMGISSSVILFNKWLLAYSGFPYPIALTLWHMFFCSTVGVLCVRVFRVVKSHNMSANDYVRRVMPIGRQLRTCDCAAISWHLVHLHRVTTCCLVRKAVLAAQLRQTDSSISSSCGTCQH